MKNWWCVRCMGILMRVGIRRKFYMFFVETLLIAFLQKYYMFFCNLSNNTILPATETFKLFSPGR